MCFELLGFDVMLTSDLKPMLLEVNHAPSFATESPLDYEIKRGLFVDMFGILGLSIDKKRAKLMAVYEDKLTRMTTKHTLKQKTEMKQKQFEDAMRVQDQLEHDNCGGFERIFPINVEEVLAKQQNSIAHKLLTNEKKTEQAAKFTLLQHRHDIYEDVLLTVNSSEHERAAR